MSVISNNQLAGASGQGGSGYEISRSLRFNSGDSSYLSRTPSSAGNTRTWTYSTWIKRSNLTAADYVSIFGYFDGTTNFTLLLFANGGDSLQFWPVQGIGGQVLETAAVLRDPSAWYHVVLAVDTTQSSASDRAHIYINGEEATYSTDNRSSLTQNTETNVNKTLLHEIGGQSQTAGGRYFDGYMAETHFIDGQQLDPTSFGEYDDNNVWQPKEYSGTYGPLVDTSQTWSNGMKTTTAATTTYSTTGRTTTFPDGLSASVPFNSNLTDYLYSQTGATGTWWFLEFATALQNVTSISFSTEYSCPGGVIKLNGTDVTVDQSNLGGGFVEVNVTGTIPSSLTEIAVQGNGGSARLQYVKINGKFLIDSGVSLPDNSFKLDFSDNTNTTTIAEDKSGNNNDWTANNISVTAGPGNDSLIDTPTNYNDNTNVGGNYCTLNPLDRQSTNGVLSNGNLDIKQTAAAWAMYRSTMFVSSGKWYWEVTLGNNQYSTIGICTDVYQMASSSNNWVTGSNEMYGYYPYSGIFVQNSSGSSYATTAGVGDVIGVALDLDNGTLTFYKNGSSLGQATSGLTGKNVSPTHWLYNQTGADSYNFGQRSFVYTPPTGFKSLCTTNLPDPTIADGSTAMDVKVRDGFDSSGGSVTGLNFSPDLIWEKPRNRSVSHYLMDSVRGSDKTLNSDSSNAEGTNANYVTSFTSDGYTLGGNDWLSSDNLAVWAWDAGSSTVSNSDGSITSNVRASQTNGFSIVTYTGTGSAGTVGHGLNAAPHMYIVKNRSSAYEWGVYHHSIGSGAAQVLNASNNNSVSGTWWNSTAPTSSVFSIGTYAAVNQNNSNFVAYCFAPVEGYSSFGSYTGNGSADGPFVFTGFRPRWVIVKASSTGGSGYDWFIMDSERNQYNAVDKNLWANLSTAEGTTSNRIDFLSNGFKINISNLDMNGSGITFLYAAFAEHPLKTARAR